MRYNKLIILDLQFPVFNTFLKKKVSQAAYTAGCETFISFTNTRYTIYFFV